MRITLHFPAESIAALRRMGMSQRETEALRWTTEHPASSHGIGVLLRGKSGDILDGRTFAALAHAFGAWIECDSADAKRRVENALVTAATGLDDAILGAKRIGRAAVRAALPRGEGDYKVRDAQNRVVLTDERSIRTGGEWFEQ